MQWATRLYLITAYGVQLDTEKHSNLRWVPGHCGRIANETVDEMLHVVGMKTYRLFYLTLQFEIHPSVVPPQQKGFCYFRVRYIQSQWRT